MSGDRRRWEQLPGEIRNQIISYLPLPGQKGSILASVCRDWQSMIEPLIFAEVRLTISRLADPRALNIMFRKRHYIHHIFLEVALLPHSYILTTSTRAPNLQPPARIAFKSLFAALGTWEPRGDLVLSIVSKISVTPTLEHILDPAVLYIDDKFEKHWWRRLPSVPAVGVVFIHTPSHTRWDPLMLSGMFTRFPNMKELCHQGCWDYVPRIILPGTGAPQWDQFTDKRLWRMVESLDTTRLCKLVLFPKCKPLQDGIEFCDPGLSRKLARASLLLTSLSAAFICDASYFFAARQADWLWERLTYLALTVSGITKGEPEIMLNRVFHDAATAAIYMPKLDTMELWNIRENAAILFRYQKAQDGQSAIITVRGSFEVPLKAEVIIAWEEVAHRRRHGNLVIKTSLIDGGKIRGLQSAILQLGLSNESAKYL